MAFFLVPYLLVMPRKKLKEGLGGHTTSHTVGPMMGGDAMMGHGYGTMKGHMKPHKSSEGFPYDSEQEIEEPDEWDWSLEPDERAKFQNKIGAAYKTTDPHARYDQRAFFDDQQWGLAAGYELGGDVIRELVALVLEDIYRMRPGSSGPSRVVNQFGHRVGTGSQFGWSSALPIDSPESREPVMSLKDIFMKRAEREGELDEDEEVE